MKNIIADLLIIGMSSAFLWHFSQIFRFEKFYIAEPNPVILMLEMCGLGAIFAFGMIKFKRDLL